MGAGNPAAIVECSGSGADTGSASPSTTRSIVFDERKKRATSSATADQSSTVGDPATSGPLNVKGKLHYFAVESFRPGIYPVAAFYDGLTMANPPKAYPPEWRQGFPGFARNYGDFMASWASVQGGKFVAASILHEDPRYFISAKKNFFARVANAVRYGVIDRSDSGIHAWLWRMWLAHWPAALLATPICPTLMRTSRTD